MSSLIEKIQLSPIGMARCINCGHRWGQHAGAFCPTEGSDKFEPEGFLLSDLCGNCGKPLKDHHKRAACKNGKNCFIKSEMFKMEDFLL